MSSTADVPVVGIPAPLRTGVHFVDQLPLVIEEVVNEYYIRHRAGQTFSAYWRAKLPEAEAARVGEDDYRPATWICERCEYRHLGEDPPVFCPGCAGVRRLFARVEDDGTASADAPVESPPARDDGFVFAARETALAEGAALSAVIGGHTCALFRIDGRVRAIDGLCPHEGGPLAEGTISKGVVTCPWHGWTFDACTGCSLEPAGNDVAPYPTLVEEGNVYLKPKTAAASAAQPSSGGSVPARAGSSSGSVPAAVALSGVRPPRPATASLVVAEVRDEAADVRTFRLDNRAGRIPHAHPGTFLQVCASVDGADAWRSFTVASSPTDPSFLELTIKRNSDGQVTNHLFDAVRSGSELTVRGTQGGFHFDPQRHREPLVLVSAGSGITPVMSIARFLAETDRRRACTFMHGSRTEDDVIFRAECQQLHDTLPFFEYHVSLSRPGPRWHGGRGRLDGAAVAALVPDVTGSRYFLCGPSTFMDAIGGWLRGAGVPADRVHTEQFHAAPPLARAG